MSVKHSLLALLRRGPAYGYQLRTEFEESTGQTWPLNIGQVYTTLERLERDGLVHDQGDDGEGHRIFAITAAGREELTQWFSQPLRPEKPPRNELAIKIALAVVTHEVNAVRDVIQEQRAATVASLRELTRTKQTLLGQVSGVSTSDEPTALASLLVQESLIFSAEAEVNWLDHCEAHLLRSTRVPKGGAS
ncbi:MAG: PadR family transcriptional regulator [Micrococcaceae bacterium]